jgi:DNA mismatch repair ATPase MutS
MSVRAELEELFKWISDLSANPASKPPQRTHRENWDRVASNLETATEWFALAVKALRRKETKRASLLAEFASDLEHQSGGLKSRAELLRREAPRKPPPTTQFRGMTLEEVLTTLVETETVLDKANAEIGNMQKQLKEAESELQAARDGLQAAAQVAIAPARTDGTAKKPPKSSADLVSDAARSLATAHKNLFKDIDRPDAVSLAFERELDLLVELTLKLHQQCEWIEDDG